MDDSVLPFKRPEGPYDHGIEDVINEVFCYLRHDYLAEVPGFKESIERLAPTLERLMRLHSHAIIHAMMEAIPGIKETMPEQPGGEEAVAKFNALFRETFPNFLEGLAYLSASGVLFIQDGNEERKITGMKKGKGPSMILTVQPDD